MTKGIPSAMTGNQMCVKRLFDALSPHWPGKWVFVPRDCDYTSGHRATCHYGDALCSDDGAIISLVSSSYYDDAKTVAIASPGTHYYDNKREYSNQIDNRWLFRDGERGYCSHDKLPKAKINTAKRDAKVIAADILRRVIVPCQGVMPDVRRLQAERAGTNDVHAQTLATLAKIKGGMTEQYGRYGSSEERHHEFRHNASGLSIDVRSGGLEVGKFSVKAEHVTSLIEWLIAHK